jgi:hypothetical protein
MAIESAMSEALKDLVVDGKDFISIRVSFFLFSSSNLLVHNTLLIPMSSRFSRRKATGNHDSS